MSSSGSPAVKRRRRRVAREEAIVAATRQLFDERGLQDARVDEIARAARLNKALIYRAFASKEEIFALVEASYLEELRTRLEEDPPAEDGVERLRETLTTFASFCVEYPAFLDCSLSLLRRPADELRETLSDACWLRVSRAAGRCVGVVQRALEACAGQTSADGDDVAFLAGRLLLGMMGPLHLARVQGSLWEPVPGAISGLSLDAERVAEASVRDALAVVGLLEGDRT